MLAIGDPDEMIAVRAVTAKASEIAQLRDANLAIAIGNQLGRVLTGKRKRG